MTQGRHKLAVGGFFGVDSFEALARARVPAGHWLGVYPEPYPPWSLMYDETTKEWKSHPPAGLLVAEQTGAKVAERLRQIERDMVDQLRGAGAAWKFHWPMFAVVAKTREEMPRHVGIQPSDPYRLLKKAAFHAIAVGRRRGDSGFLRDLAKEARSAGMERGRPTKAAGIQRMMRVLQEGTKGVAAENADNYESTLRALSVEKDRFCARVCDAVQSISPRLPADASDGTILSALRKAGVASWPGVNLRGCRHQKVLIGAYRLGARTPRERLARLLRRPWQSC